MQYKSLFVDDESANLRVLERLFRNDYEVFSAASGPEALELLALHDFALIVCTGARSVRRVEQSIWMTPVQMIRRGRLPVCRGLGHWL